VVLTSGLEAAEEGYVLSAQGIELQSSSPQPVALKNELAQLQIIIIIIIIIITIMMKVF
jgi:hypothetical protein